MAIVDHALAYRKRVRPRRLMIPNAKRRDRADQLAGGSRYLDLRSTREEAHPHGQANSLIRSRGSRQYNVDDASVRTSIRIGQERSKKGEHRRRDDFGPHHVLTATAFNTDAVSGRTASDTDAASAGECGTTCTCNSPFLACTF